MSVETSYADKLRFIRTQHGHNQREFAEALGVGHASIERWERGAQLRSVIVRREIERRYAAAIIREHKSTGLYQKEELTAK